MSSWQPGCQLEILVDATKSTVVRGRRPRHKYLTTTFTMLVTGLIMCNNENDDDDEIVIVIHVPLQRLNDLERHGLAF